MIIKLKDWCHKDGEWAILKWMDFISMVVEATKRKVLWLCPKHLANSSVVHWINNRIITCEIVRNRQAPPETYCIRILHQQISNLSCSDLWFPAIEDNICVYQNIISTPLPQITRIQFCLKMSKLSKFVLVLSLPLLVSSWVWRKNPVYLMGHEEHLRYINT